MIIEKTTTRCTDCYSEFTEEQLEGTSSCPTCNTKSLPMKISQDTIVSLNWHELRILTMWATWYAEEKLKSEPGYHTLKAIIKRLKRQGRPEWPGLTFADEIEDLRNETGLKVDYIHDGKIDKDPRGDA